MTSLDETKFQALKNAIVDKIPCCGGILPVSAHELVLFYGKGPDARYDRLTKLFNSLLIFDVQSDRSVGNF